MNPTIVLRDRPTSRPDEIQEDLHRVVDQLGDGATAMVTIGLDLVSGANKIRHNLARAPRAATFYPRANVATWETQAPDGIYVYISTAGVVTGNLYVWR